MNSNSRSYRALPLEYDLKVKVIVRSIMITYDTDSKSRSYGDAPLQYDLKVKVV